MPVFVLLQKAHKSAGGYAKMLIQDVRRGMVQTCGELFSYALRTFHGMESALQGAAIPPGTEVRRGSYRSLLL